MLFVCAVPTEHARKAEGSAVTRMLEKHVASGDVFRGIYSASPSAHLLTFSIHHAVGLRNGMKH